MSETRTELVELAKAEAIENGFCPPANFGAESEDDDFSSEDDESENEEEALIDAMKGTGTKDLSGKKSKWTPETRLKDYQRQLRKEAREEKKKVSDQLCCIQFFDF